MFDLACQAAVKLSSASAATWSSQHNLRTQHRSVFSP